MRLSIGLSSNTLPQATAAELGTVVAGAGGEVVDLRMDRGQAWESTGACAGFAVLADAGMSVAFVSRAPVEATEVGLGCACHGPDFTPVKVATTSSSAGFVAAAVDAGWQVLLETHAGGSSADELLEACETAPVRLVFDNRGWFQLGATRRMFRLLAPYVDFVQVKGFDQDDPGLRHRSLRPEGLSVIAELLAAGAPVRAVTVETRASQPLADLELVNQFVAEELGRTTEEVVA